MDAVISGRAGIAILLGPRTKCLREAGESQVVSDESVPLLFAGFSDLRVLQDVDSDQVRAQLAFEATCDDSLHLVLILLDPEMSQDIRRDASVALDELLQAHGVSHFLESVLYAHPIPAAADVGGALSICNELQAGAIEKVLSDLRENQPSIRQVYNSWEAIPSDVFSIACSRTLFQTMAIAEGVFRDFVLAIASSDISHFLASASSRPNINAFQESGGILARWIAPFQQIVRFAVEARDTDRGKTSADAVTDDLDLISDLGRDLAPKEYQRLSELCRLYWRPIFSIICRKGYPAADAQDLTQDFFLKILEGTWLHTIDTARGRFRSLLFLALTDFLTDVARKRVSRHSSDKVKFVSWDEWMAEAPSQVSVPASELASWPAEQLFDVSWAAAIVEQALRRLREECEGRGRLRAFDVLKPCLGAERENVSYAALAQSLGVPETTVKRLLHRLRQRYRTLLREEVAETLASPAEVDDEIRYLCSVLAADVTIETQADQPVLKTRLRPVPSLAISKQKGLGGFRELTQLLAAGHNG